MRGVAFAALVVSMGACRPFGAEPDERAETRPPPAPDVVATPPYEPATLWVKQFTYGFHTISGFWGAMTFAVDHDRNIVLAGRLWSEADFGLGKVAPRGRADVIVVKLDPDGRPMWMRQFGGGDSWIGATAVAIDDANDIYVSGSANGDVDDASSSFELPDGTRTIAGRDDAFVLSLSPQGTFRWARHFGGTGRDTLRVARVDHGRVFVVGRTSSSAFAVGGAPFTGATAFSARLDAATGADGGNAAISSWTVGSYFSEVVSADGAITVVGTNDDPLTLAGETPAVGPFVIRYALDGAPVASRRFDELDSAGPATIGGDGAVYLVGTLAGAIDSRPHIVRLGADLAISSMASLGAADGRSLVDRARIDAMSPAPAGIVAAGTFDGSVVFEDRRIDAAAEHGNRGFIVMRYAGRELRWAKAIERRFDFAGIVHVATDDDGNTIALADDGGLMLVKLGR